MNATYPLTLFYDAACPVCSLEMDHLREHNRDGRPYAIAGARADRGVEVLRLAYAAAGLGWVLQPTGWAPLRPLFDAGYRVFARHRRAISRAAAPLIDSVRAARARRMTQRMRDCAAGACEPATTDKVRSSS